MTSRDVLNGEELRRQDARIAAYQEHAQDLQKLLDERDADLVRRLDVCRGLTRRAEQAEANWKAADNLVGEQFREFLDIQSQVAALREALEAVLADDNSKRCLTDITMSNAIIEGVKAALMDTSAAAEQHDQRIRAEGRKAGLVEAARKAESIGFPATGDFIRALITTAKEGPDG